MAVAKPRPDLIDRRPARSALDHLRRRRLVAAGLGATAMRGARAQTGAPWPQRPVRIVVGSAPGGGPDLVARLLARSWSAMLGQPVLVDNRVGANGGLAMENVVRAGDDHALLFGTTGSVAINNELFPALAVDSLRDFSPVGLIVETPFFFAVAPRLGVDSLAAFVRHARERPGALNYGSPGVGTAQHFAFEQFRRSLDLDILHVPYRGIAAALQDLAGGRLDLVIDAYASLHAAEQAGHARVAAVTSSERAAWRPDVPTVAEAAGLPGYELQAWMALLAPAATPAAIRRMMEAALATALRDGELPEQLAQGGFLPRFRGGPAARSFIEAERGRYGALIRAAGIRPDGG